MRKKVENVVVTVLVYIAIGACIMAGMKLIDWAIPDKPRTVNLDIRCSELLEKEM